MADFMVLNKNFENLATIDVYESLIWTDRYNKPGDFEIYTNPSEENLANMKEDYYIWKSDSEHLMIIESLRTTTDVEEGQHLIVAGRSLESIMNRRIVWGTIDLDGKIQGQIKKLLTESVINPSDPDRKISNFIFVENNDPRLDKITVRAQYTGDYLLDILNKLCESKGVGWKITLTTNNEFAFQLYIGTDRSYDQTDNPYVEFSPNFDNLEKSDYLQDKTEYKTVALVAGEGEDEQRKKKEVYVTHDTGLSRRELYVDARDISSNVEGSDTPMPDNEYYALLTQRGEEDLTEHKISKMFEGEVDTQQLYRYGEDFFMGDICQLENEFGMTGKVRVTEFIYSHSINEGYNEYPTFVVLDEDEKEE